MKSIQVEIKDTSVVALLSNVEIQAGCWFWRGQTMTSGYPRILLDGKRQLAHRVAYQLFNGDLVPGKVIDHTCHNRDKQCKGGYACKHRRCVNPIHLGQITIGENVLRGMTLSAANKAKTHCIRGHEFTEDNIYRDRSYPEKRYCRACFKIRSLG